MTMNRKETMEQTSLSVNSNELFGKQEDKILFSACLNILFMFYLPGISQSQDYFRITALGIGAGVEQHVRKFNGGSCNYVGGFDYSRMSCILNLTSNIPELVCNCTHIYVGPRGNPPTKAAIRD